MNGASAVPAYCAEAGRPMLLHVSLRRVVFGLTLVAGGSRNGDL